MCLAYHTYQWRGEIFDSTPEIQGTTFWHGSMPENRNGLPFIMSVHVVCNEFQACDSEFFSVWFTQRNIQFLAEFEFMQRSMAVFYAKDLNHGFQQLNQCLNHGVNCTEGFKFLQTWTMNVSYAKDSNTEPRQFAERLFACAMRPTEEDKESNRDSSLLLIYPQRLKHNGWTSAMNESHPK